MFIWGYMERLDSAIVKPYEPKHFGRDYCELNGSRQYPMFLAAAFGMKKCYDDWVGTDKYGRFVDVCGRYGLFVEPDVVFAPESRNKDDVIGGKTITTTYNSGKRFSADEKGGKVHVFVSRSEEHAKNAKRFGWYPVVIGARSTNKPFIDHLRFGKCLGFPDCCIDFFRLYNDWSRYSNPFETYRNTPRQEHKAAASYYCNNFLMDKTYSLIHHLPCSYRCGKTMDFAAKLESEIEKVEPDFIEKARMLLKMPLLVFKEHNFVIFNSVGVKNCAAGKILEYEGCQYINNPARPEDTIDFFGSIEGGNSVLLGTKDLAIMDKSSILKKIRREPEWFILDFD